MSSARMAGMPTESRAAPAAVVPSKTKSASNTTHTATTATKATTSASKTAALGPEGAPSGGQSASARPRVANLVAVLPSRAPSRRISTRDPAPIARFSPEFQFTENPSLLRRLLVSVIVACISPSLLWEDLFPPLTLVFSKQAAYGKP